MTPGFLHPEALALLLIIPLFLVLHKRRSRPRTVTVTLFPLFEKLTDRHRPPPSFFRPRRRTRAILISTAIACLALAASGSHLELSKRQPIKWLFVLDNSYSLNARTGNGSAHDHLFKVAENVLETIPGEDSLSLLSLSPEPRLYVDLTIEALTDRVKLATPSSGGASLERMYSLVEELTADKDRLQTILLTTRVQEWERALSEGGSRSNIQVLEAAVTETGNVGIVAFDLRPSPSQADRYDLFFKVAGRAMDSNIRTVNLFNGGTLVRSYLVTLDTRGRASVGHQGLDLKTGSVDLVLAGRDLLPDDNQIAATVHGSEQVSVRLNGPREPFITSAITAHQGFSMVSSNAASVEVIYGAKIPEKLEKPSLIIDPRESFLSFRYAGILENPGEAVFEPLHPLTRHIGFRNFRPSRTSLFEPPKGVWTLARAGEAPLVLAGEIDGLRTVVWTFNPMDGTVALDPSFVMLLRTSIEWLAGTEPVVWSPGPGCGTGAETFLQGTPDMGRPGNILCESTTLETSSVSLQDPASIKSNPVSDVETVRTDLSQMFLFPVIGILLYLLTVDILSGRKVSL